MAQRDAKIELPNFFCCIHSENTETSAMSVPPPGFQKGRVTYVQNGAHFARRRVARAQVRASEALRLLGRGVWGQAP